MENDTVSRAIRDKRILFRKKILPKFWYPRYPKIIVLSCGSVCQEWQFGIGFVHLETCTIICTINFYYPKEFIVRLIVSKISPREYWVPWGISPPAHTLLELSVSFPRVYKIDKSNFYSLRFRNHSQFEEIFIRRSYKWKWRMRSRKPS